MVHPHLQIAGCTRRRCLLAVSSGPSVSLASKPSACMQSNTLHESTVPTSEYYSHGPPGSLPAAEQVHAYNPQYVQPWPPPPQPPGFHPPHAGVAPQPPPITLKPPPDLADDPRAPRPHPNATASSGLSGPASSALSASDVPASAASYPAYAPGSGYATPDDPAASATPLSGPTPPLAKLRVPPADPSGVQSTPSDSELRPGHAPDRRSHRVHTPPSSGGHQFSPLAVDPGESPAPSVGVPPGAVPVAAAPEGTLALALDYYAKSRAPFLDRYIITGPGDRRMGGQGVVQFARDASTQESYAIKFFTRRAGFERERALYDKPALRSMMPAVIDVVPNADGRYATPAGFVFPPCIVVEKGESLDEWATRIEPGFPTILNVRFSCVL